MQIKFWDLRMPSMPTSTAQPLPPSASTSARHENCRKGRSRQVGGDQGTYMQASCPSL